MFEGLRFVFPVCISLFLLFFFLFFDLTFYHLIISSIFCYYHLYIRYIFVIEIINAFHTPNHLKIFLLPCNNNMKISKIVTTDEKKGVDRSSTVVLRDPGNEGEFFADNI